MVGTPNFGHILALMGTGMAFYLSDVHQTSGLDGMIIKGIHSFGHYPATIVSWLTNLGLRNEGVLTSEAVSALDPWGDYLGDLNNRNISNDIKVNTVCGRLVGKNIGAIYTLATMINDPRYYGNRIGRILYGYQSKGWQYGTKVVYKYGRRYLLRHVVAVAAVTWLFETDGVVARDSQAFDIADGGQVNSANITDIAHPIFHTFEPTEQDYFMRLLDETPQLEVLSPQANQVLSGDSLLIEGRFWDYLPANVSIRAIVGLTEGGLAADRSPKPLDITNTTITVDGKYNAGFSFEIDASEYNANTY
ncbi:MAG: hypothetical protein JXM68_07500, partial [Sedimentisphaerales bacterium]|nr:hypothetical protein [Sedimentisphaerales bacterium]